MADDQNKQNTVTQQPQQDTGERPLDPSRNAGDLFGDTSGMTGVTTGSAQQTSAEPSDQVKDENKSHLPGGIQEDPTHVNSDGLPQVTQSPGSGMSSTAQAAANDIASEPSNLTASQNQQQSDAQQAPSIDPAATANATAQTPPPGQSNQTAAQSDDDWRSSNVFNPQNNSGDDSPNSQVINTEQAPYHGPANLGEQTVSGTTPDPSSDDDTLANAHAVGTQLKDTDEGEGQREELDIGRDIDESEQAIKES